MMNVLCEDFPYSTDLREERNGGVREGVIQLESGSLVSYSILPAAPSFMHVTTLASYVVVILGVARIYTPHYYVLLSVWKTSTTSDLIFGRRALFL